MTTLVDDLMAWAASGAMWLTGRPDGPPLGPPDGFVGRLRVVGRILTETAEKMGRPVAVDVLGLLGERAAIAGLRRGGQVSCGGSARLLPTADGWLAVNLARPDDLELLPAWLADGELRPGHDVWAAVAQSVAIRSTEPLAQRAQLLGLPAAALPHLRQAVPRATGPLAGLPVVASCVSQEAGRQPLESLFVADLSSLWAGPLCTHLLQRAGARVVKVESAHRPDGARSGPAAFFDLLHAGQEAVALDFREADSRADLKRVLETADVVVEGSRPRALEQLGIFAEPMLTEAAERGAGPRIWLSITGYGRADPGRNWAAFGDDAAVAGGLVAWDEAGPCFLADAAADPCAGMVAAAATLRALAAGGRWLLDVSMRDVAAHLAGPKRSRVAPPPSRVGAARPTAREAAGRSPRLGEHTEGVLREVRRR